MIQAISPQLWRLRLKLNNCQIIRSCYESIFCLHPHPCLRPQQGNPSPLVNGNMECLPPELEQLKQELLIEIRQDMERIKLEILAAVRSETE